MDRANTRSKAHRDGPASTAIAIWAFLAPSFPYRKIAPGIAYVTEMEIASPYQVPGKMSTTTDDTDSCLKCFTPIRVQASGLDSTSTKTTA